jgi:hypothetical protein
VEKYDRSLFLRAQSVFIILEYCSHFCDTVSKKIDL